MEEKKNSKFSLFDAVGGRWGGRGGEWGSTKAGSVGIPSSWEEPELMWCRLGFCEQPLCFIAVAAFQISHRFASNKKNDRAEL